MGYEMPLDFKVKRRSFLFVQSLSFAELLFSNAKQSSVTDCTKIEPVSKHKEQMVISEAVK